MPRVIMCAASRAWRAFLRCELQQASELLPGSNSGGVEKRALFSEKAREKKSEFEEHFDAVLCEGPAAGAQVLQKRSGGNHPGHDGVAERKKFRGQKQPSLQDAPEIEARAFQRAARRADAMPANRRRNIHDFPSESGSAPADFRVLVTQRQAAVEAAELVKHGFANEHAGGGSEKHGDRLRHGLLIKE